MLYMLKNQHSYPSLQHSKWESVTEKVILNLLAIGMPALDSFPSIFLHEVVRMHSFCLQNRTSKSLKTINNQVFQSAVTVLSNHTVLPLAFQWICAHWPTLKKCWKFSHMRVIYGVTAGRSILIFNTSWISNLAMKQRWLLLLQRCFMRK